MQQIQALLSPIFCKLQDIRDCKFPSATSIRLAAWKTVLGLSFFFFFLQHFGLFWTKAHSGLPHRKICCLLSLSRVLVSKGSLESCSLRGSASALFVLENIRQCYFPYFFANTNFLSGLVHCLSPLHGFSTDSQKESRHTILMKSSACKERIYISVLAFAIGFTSDCSSETNYPRKTWVWVPTDVSRMNSLIYSLSTGKQKVMITKKKSIF